MSNYTSDLSVYLGDSTSGEAIYLDFGKCPHLLTVGNTGSGKSEALHRIIEQLSKKVSTEEAKFILIDPKRVEFGVWKELPHLYAPIASGVAPGREAIASACLLMRERIAGRAEKETPLFLFIDEVVDLVVGDGKEKTVEEIKSLLTDGADANVHLIAATQAPWHVFVPNGIAFESFPYRLVGRMYDKKDSKLYLGNEDATKLEGFRGEMILLSPDERMRLQVHRAEVFK